MAGCQSLKSFEIVDKEAKRHISQGSHLLWISGSGVKHERSSFHLNELGYPSGIKSARSPRNSRVAQQGARLGLPTDMTKERTAYFNVFWNNLNRVITHPNRAFESGRAKERRAAQREH